MSLEQTLATLIREAVRDVVREEMGGRGQPMGEYLTPAEVAKMMRCSASTVRSWVASGVLAATGAGRLRRFAAADVRALQTRKVSPKRRTPPDEAEVIATRLLAAVR